MRLDLELVKDWVKPGTRVLDLGCGDGALLEDLQKTKQVNGIGVEVNPDHITTCIARGLSVVEQNLDEGLSRFRTGSFDTVTMSLALQALHRPDLVLDEMLRVGKQCIVTFPNFGNWRVRLSIGVQGRMPVSRHLPWHWYDTPNIHFCTVRDFEALCLEKNIQVLNRKVISPGKRDNRLATTFPNLFGMTAVYHLAR